MKSLWPLARPILGALDPERAHDATLRAIASLPFKPPPPEDPRLAINVFGLRFANPIGLAAGFDKNGLIAHKASALGLGFIEIGTLTPKPQPGNPKPRLFRLTKQGGVINRFGFNNLGHARAKVRLRKGSGILGVNIGANKDATDRIADYVAGIVAFADVADYFTVNVSSPNTPGLRDLQKAAALDELLARVIEAREAQVTAHARRPVLLKIAPDLALHELDDIVRVARHRRVDGMIVSNTTVSRPLPLGATHASEAGGLSGRPLFDLSTHMLAQTYMRCDGQFPLVGVGGIDCAEAAWRKIGAGASLLQLYSGLVFQGPPLIDRIKTDLLSHVTDVAGWQSYIGYEARRWCQTIS